MISKTYDCVLIHSENNEESFTVQAVNDRQALMFAMEHCSHIDDQSYSIHVNLDNVLLVNMTVRKRSQAVIDSYQPFREART